MPLPSNVTMVTVTRDYTDNFGSDASGTVTFTPAPPELLDVTSTPPTTIVTGFSPFTGNISSGLMTTQIIACDDPDIQPSGWTYTVNESVKVGGKTVNLAPWSLFVSVTDGTVDLTLRAPVPSSPGVFASGGSAGVTSVNGDAGPAVTLASTDLADAPGSTDAWTYAQQQAASAQSAANTYTNAQILALSAGGFKGTKAIPSTPYHLLNADNGYLLEWTGAGVCTIIVDPDSTGHYSTGFSVAAVQAQGAGTITWQGVTPATLTIPTSGTASNVSNTANNTVALTAPGIILNGDSVVVIAQLAGTRTFSGGSLSAGFQTVASGIGPANALSYVFKAINVTSAMAGASLTFPFTTSAAVWQADLVVIRGGDTSDFVDGYANTSTTNTSTTPTLATVAPFCGWLSLSGSSNATTVYSANPYTAGAGITKAIDGGTTTAAGGNSAAAIGYAGSGGTLTQYAAGHSIGGDVWSVAGNRNAHTMSIKPLLPAGAVILPTDNNSTRLAGSMITLVRRGADLWYAGGPT